MTEKQQLKRTKDGAFMVADLLEKGGFHPIVARMSPYWVPPMPAQLQAIVRQAVIPTVSWRGDVRDLPEGTPMTDIDANAAYLAAASSATFAHGPLEHTGAHDAETEGINPGYYLVDVHHWNMGAPGSPLGGARIRESAAWVTHVTYKMLRDLTYGASWTPGGHWPSIKAYDSWTSGTSCRFTSWTNAIRDTRAQMLLHGDTEAYEALKLGYSQAIEMWATPPDAKGTAAADRKKRNRAYRPDWFATLRSQHQFNMWRRAYQATLAGHPPVQLGGAGHATDGMAFATTDLGAVLTMPKSPIRLDEAGLTLGTFKRTRRYYHGIDEVDGA